MDREYIFHPDRRLGLAVHLAALAGLAGAGAWGLWRASLASMGTAFLLYLAPALAALVLGPALVYRIYALRGASYRLEREGLRLRWGLRNEDIPIDDVVWIRQPKDLKRPLPRPWLGWPGAMLGVRRLPEGDPLSPAGEVEFLAADMHRLVLVGTTEKIYAISPSDPQAFLQAFQRLTELGSLFPIPARSVYPVFLAGRVWADAPARILLGAGLLLSLFLLGWASAAVPTRTQVYLSFLPSGEPRDLVPAVRLLMLPVLNAIIFLIDFFLGLFFYRREEGRAAILAYFLWGSSVLTALLFLIGVFQILRVPTG